MEAKELIAKIESGDYNDTILDIYVDEGKVEYQRQRYMDAINQYISAFGNDDVEIYSAPGRSEVGGNHTDHQHGEVLAASINLDAKVKYIPILHPLVFRAIHRIRTCKPFRAHGFLDRFLTTRTYGITSAAGLEPTHPVGLLTV